MDRMGNRDTGYQPLYPNTGVPNPMGYPQTNAVQNPAAAYTYFMGMPSAAPVMQTYNPYAAAMNAAYAPMQAMNVPQTAQMMGVPAASAMQQPSNPDQEISVWMGDLDPYMDEAFLAAAVAAAGWSDYVIRIKIIRDRGTGNHAGYGFLQVRSIEAANHIIQYGNGMPIARTNRSWRLQMGRISGGASSGAASGGVNPYDGGSQAARGNMSQSLSGAEANVYVGDLDPLVSDFELLSLFRSRFATARHAKVMCDEIGKSRGYGFVRFANMQDAQVAVDMFNGQILRSRAIRVNIAHRSSNPGGAGSGGAGGGGAGGGGAGGGGHFDRDRDRDREYDRGNQSTGVKRRRDQSTSSPNGNADESITTLFVGGTSSTIQESILWQEFGTYGKVQAVKLPVTKSGFAFVRFANRSDAESAKQALNGVLLPALNPARSIRVEWAAEQLPVLGSGGSNDKEHGADENVNKIGKRERNHGDDGDQDRSGGDGDDKAVEQEDGQGKLKQRARDRHHQQPSDSLGQDPLKLPASDAAVYHGSGDENDGEQSSSSGDAGKEENKESGKETSQGDKDGDEQNKAEDN